MIRVRMSRFTHSGDEPLHSGMIEIGLMNLFLFIKIGPG
jgi:hypothetical protein